MWEQRSGHGARGGRKELPCLVPLRGRLQVSLAFEILELPGISTVQLLKGDSQNLVWAHFVFI